LAAAINRLLGNDAERARMGRQARERVEREFRAEDIARREFDLYQEVLR
jgi:glycosyltransferase involved in cell wall biosynthesis